ncbi:hypothetical protein DPMN_110477 [Dreissena polymorpha]|uniref:Uncharacterized protein n=1 Tax=Dreissena polymorpha TaxID=45954 RepID=A0A9D4KCQ7_DREPO|nr:hypothetical protein DPMN_110477 [Dreissena polymorpha]
MENVRILDLEPSWFDRGVKEAINIRTLRPALNKDRGRYQLSHTWDHTLTSLTPTICGINVSRGPLDDCCVNNFSLTLSQLSYSG